MPYAIQNVLNARFSAELFIKIFKFHFFLFCFCWLKFFCLFSFISLINFLLMNFMQCVCTIDMKTKLKWAEQSRDVSFFLPTFLKLIYIYTYGAYIFEVKARKRWKKRYENKEKELRLPPSSLSSYHRKCQYEYFFTIHLSSIVEYLFEIILNLMTISLFIMT